MLRAGAILPPKKLQKAPVETPALVSRIVLEMQIHPIPRKWYRRTAFRNAILRRATLTMGTAGWTFL